MDGQPNNNKLLIYLGDLDHFTYGNRISIPLNIACIASYCKNLFGKEIEILLFKDPILLMRQIKYMPPHILGLSFYMWNVNLSLKIIECCKSISPSTITVIGGPSVARISDRYKILLDRNPSVDIVVRDQGEKSFANILYRILSKGRRRKAIFNEAIPGCVIRRDGSGIYERGAIVDEIQGIEKIPSPYLKGYLNSFLELGFLPLIETTRGCPYSCTFCERGDQLFSKLIVRDESIIYEELLYLSKYSKSRELCITDSNFGLLGERDLRIALFMADLHKKHNFPSVVTDYASAKVATKQSMEVMKTMARLSGYFYFGLQTLTQHVLKNSKRVNMPIDAMKELIILAKKENLPIAVDLIFGLPEETPTSFMETISRLIRLGIDGLAIYNLRLLPGTIIAEEEREKYSYITRFRPFNNRYGEYRLISDEKPLRIIEVEEIAYQSNMFDKNNFDFMRKCGFLIELLIRFGAFKETVNYLTSRHADVIKMIEIILKDHHKYSNLSILLAEYESYSKAELFVSEEDLINKICKDNAQWQNLVLQGGKFFKINLGFIGYCLFENTKVLNEIEDIIYTYAKKNLSAEELENLSEVIRYDKLHRLLIDGKNGGRLNEMDIKKEIYVEEQYDLNKWKLNNYKGNIANYKFHKPATFIYYVERYEDFLKIIRRLSNFSGYNFYEKILMEAPKISLIRSYKK